MNKIVKVGLEPTPADGLPARLRIALQAGHPSGGGELRSAGAMSYDPLLGGVRDLSRRLVRHSIGDGGSGFAKGEAGGGSDLSAVVRRGET